MRDATMPPGESAQPDRQRPLLAALTLLMLALSGAALLHLAREADYAAVSAAFAAMPPERLGVALA